MNGAMAVPLVATMRAPTSTRTKRTGSNQNFRCSRMNPKSSITNDMVASILSSERGGPRSRRRPIDPVGLGVRGPVEPQQILAKYAHQNPSRSNGPEVDGEQHEWREDAMQRQPEPSPEPVERPQRSWQQHREREEHHRRREPPPGMRSGKEDLEGCQRRARRSNGEPEAPIRTPLDAFLAAEAFVRPAVRERASARHSLHSASVAS